MTWATFDVNTALERDLLLRSLPLIPTQSDGSSSATIDFAADTANVAISVVDTVGATPSECVDLLAIRPLLVGAAWKILDLLFETALEERPLFSQTLHVGGRYLQDCPRPSGARTASGD